MKRDTALPCLSRVSQSTLSDTAVSSTGGPHSFFSLRSPPPPAVKLWRQGVWFARPYALRSSRARRFSPLRQGRHPIGVLPRFFSLRSTAPRGARAGTVVAKRAVATRAWHCGRTSRTPSYSRLPNNDNCPSSASNGRRVRTVASRAATFARATALMSHSLISAQELDCF